MLRRRLPFPEPTPADSAPDDDDLLLKPKVVRPAARRLPEDARKVATLRPDALRERVEVPVEGINLLGGSARRSRAVLYVDAELPYAVMKAWEQRLGPETENFALLSNTYNFRRGKPQVTLATEEGREYLRQQIESFEPDLVILDALFTLVPPSVLDGRVSESEWPAVIAFLREQKAAGRHVLLLHHDGKGGTQYGQSIKEIEFDLMMQMKAKDAQSGDGKRVFELSFPKQRFLSIEEAQTRIVTATEEGPIFWERTDRPADDRRTQARERRAQVQALVEEGCKPKAIAERIGISERRVRQILEELEQSGLW